MSPASLIEDRASHPTNAPDAKDEVRRLVDLVFVSVLLTGTWKYTEEQSGKTFTQSEGLAVASVHMFKSGLFSSDSQAAVSS